MQFRYKARTGEGEGTEGVIDAANLDLAVSSLQRRNFLVISIEPVEGPGGVERVGKITEWLGIFESIPMEDVVILTRQLSTLFEAKVPVVESLKIITGETENRKLRRHISDLLDDIQGGMPMSGAMARHPEVFSRFYVAMIKSGEESGKLEDIFKFLADYLERSYELSRKARNALIYPAFVLSTFIIVMAMMLALEITSEVVGNEVYRKILLDSMDSVKSGSMISESLAKYADIPPLLSQMIRIGEETGKLDYILKSVAGFYRRDVDNFIDNLVSLIEPILIVGLGLGVGVLVAAVLVPIYNISTTF